MFVCVCGGGRGQIRGCLTEMGKGLLGGACLEWGLSGWAGQPYGNTGKRQAGAFNSAVEEEEEREEGRREVPRGREELLLFRFQPNWLRCFGLFDLQTGCLKGGNRSDTVTAAAVRRRNKANGEQVG